MLRALMRFYEVEIPRHELPAQVFASLRKAMRLAHEHLDYIDWLVDTRRKPGHLTAKLVSQKLNVLPGDVNRDKAVNASDLVLVRNRIGSSSPKSVPWKPPYGANGSSVSWRVPPRRSMSGPGFHPP